MSNNTACKQRVYFNEYNVLMEKTAYLPFVSGLLQAYAQTDALIARHYSFMPFLFHRDDPEHILSAYENPAVAAFSVCMWNEQLCLAVAREVKRSYPACLIVFGGPQVPHHPKVYFERHPFIDVAVRGEGERTFAEILARFVESRDFTGIAGTAFRDPRNGQCVRTDADRPHVLNLDVFPSPYLTSLFDALMTSHREWCFQAIVETNRGCPFLCSYCMWGQGGLNRRYRFHSLERTAAEIDWCGRNHIVYVFNADSNFGIHPRDLEIARLLVKIKQRYGYPEKFRSCYSKNTCERIYQIAKLLHHHELDKGITLSLQSVNAEVLRNVRRDNIKQEVFRSLQKRFNNEGIPAYTELILGLPGETRASWRAGVEEVLASGLENQLFIYLCQVYPNTELADPTYQARHGVTIKQIDLNEIHGAIRPSGSIAEREDIVVATASMPLADWRWAVTFSWTTMTLHSLKLGFYIMLYLKQRWNISYADFMDYLCGDYPQAPGWHAELSFYRTKLDRLLDGKEGRGNIIPEFGPIYWDQEEATFLRLCRNIDRFYDELQALTATFLAKHSIHPDPREFAEVFMYQRLRVPRLKPLCQEQWSFSWNLPEFFEKALTADCVPLSQTDQPLRLCRRDFGGDPIKFARETVLRGRKSGAIAERVLWGSSAGLP